jgi:uncharacterized protein (DUF1499 family)
MICCAFTPPEGFALETPSRVATLASHLGVAGVLTLLLGPLTIQIGALSPFVGFQLFLLGGLCGLLALLLGAIGLWRTRATAGREGRGRALRGALLGAAIVALIAVSAGSARGLPTINDITTDPDDPPAFVFAAQLPENQGRDLSYPADFAAKQRAGYPDLAPIRLPAGLSDAFQQCERAAESLGWVITYRYPDQGMRTLEATETSRIFRFVDDISVRLRADGETTVIDVRSKSRVGRGDMGANAKRIEAFRKKLTSAAG